MLMYRTAVVVNRLHITLKKKVSNRSVWLNLWKQWEKFWAMKPHLTSAQWWYLTCQYRSHWQAWTQSPSHRWRSASSETPGWASAACRRQSWSSRPHDGADSHSHSLCWYYRLVSWLCCSPSGSARMDEKVKLKRSTQRHTFLWKADKCHKSHKPARHNTSHVKMDEQAPAPWKFDVKSSLQTWTVFEHTSLS